MAVGFKEESVMCSDNEIFLFSSIIDVIYIMNATDYRRCGSDIIYNTLFGSRGVHTPIYASFYALVLFDEAIGEPFFFQLQLSLVCSPLQ